jgi:hypothetical protein
MSFVFRVYARFYEEPPHGTDGSPVRFLLRMGPMKHGANATQCDPDPGSATLGNIGAKVQQEGFDIRPQDVSPLFEDRFQCSLVPIHEFMVSSDDTIRHESVKPISLSGAPWRSPRHCSKL